MQNAESSVVIVTTLSVAVGKATAINHTGLPQCTCRTLTSIANTQVTTYAGTEILSSKDDCVQMKADAGPCSQCFFADGLQMRTELLISPETPDAGRLRRVLQQPSVTKILRLKLLPLSEAIVGARLRTAL